MKLRLREIDKSGVVRVTAEGDITIRDFADPGKNPLELVLGEGWAGLRVLLGLDKISFIDSSAIGWMIDCNRKFKEKKGRMILYAPTPRVKDMIDLLKMREVLEIHNTEAEAMAALVSTHPNPPQGNP
ncbi:MAG TPA: STAS domain-containing protein [Tepidisphaeraceae bacterium]|nr:STAS domain-containing protein [Tepidisphaeraceae bacterium]